jgi:hypothetical protein
MRRSGLLSLTLLLIATAVLSACGAPSNGQASGGAAAAGKADVSALPKAMQDAPARVRAAYQFAVANPDALKNVACYCGCGAMGHTSNLSCYIKDRKADGQIEFEEHALGCSLCVDIAQDVMRMTGEGKPAADIHAAIVSAYSKFGPGNQ